MQCDQDLVVSDHNRHRLIPKSWIASKFAISSALFGRLSTQVALSAVLRIGDHLPQTFPLAHCVRGLFG
jgi:hypothetical protein